MGVDVSVGSGVFVGAGVFVGSGVFVGAGVSVGSGASVDVDVLVGSDVLVGEILVGVTLTFAAADVGVSSGVGKMDTIPQQPQQAIRTVTTNAKTGMLRPNKVT